MSTLTSLTSQGQVTIPKAIREFLDLHTKDKIKFVKKDNKVYIEPAKNFLDIGGSISQKKVYSDESADKSILKHIKDEYKKSSN